MAGCLFYIGHDAIGDISKSKTESGHGRTIPLSKRVCAVLSPWLSRFPNAQPENYVFPAYQVGMAGNGRQPVAYGFDPERPAEEWKKAWTDACRKAGLKFRWHDLGHTFISRLAENPAVSEQTIMALAGHVSKSMLARYSHIRQAAKQAAIDALERPDFGPGLLQNPLHLPEGKGLGEPFIPEKALN